MFKSVDRTLNFSQLVALVYSSNISGSQLKSCRIRVSLMGVKVATKVIGRKTLNLKWHFIHSHWTIRNYAKSGSVQIHAKTSFHQSVQRFAHCIFKLVILLNNTNTAESRQRTLFCKIMDQATYTQEFTHLVFGQSMCTDGHDLLDYVVKRLFNCFAKNLVKKLTAEANQNSGPLSKKTKNPKINQLNWIQKLSKCVVCHLLLAINYVLCLCRYSRLRWLICGIIIA